MRIKPLNLLLLALLILGFLLGAYEGFWKQGAKKVTNSAEQLEQNGGEIYLQVIWDASGSMWGREQGIEKILKSKDVLKNFAAQIPQEVNLALRIFGARKVGDLKDSFLAVPFNNGERAGLINFITNVNPLGKSPIGYSLKEAKNDLAVLNGQKHILLISDGIDNGELPTAEIVQELVDRQIVLHIIHIGDLKNKPLKEKLQEMAEKTGGSYLTYDDHNRIIPTFQQ